MIKGRLHPNTARCAKIANRETRVETLHVTSLHPLTEQY